MSDAEIYLKHRDDLIRYASVLVGPAHAEDVLSAVVVRILGAGGFDRIDEPRSYLFRAVLNEARSTLRARRPVELPDVPVDLKAQDIDLLDAVR